MNVKLEMRRLELALSRPNVDIEFTALELAQISQMCATMASLGFIGEPFANEAGETIFKKCEDLLRENGIIVKTGDKPDELYEKVEKLGLPNQTVNLKAAGVIGLAGIFVQHQNVFLTIGGALLAAQIKISKLGIDLVRGIQNEIEAELSTEPNMKPAQA